MYHKTLSYYSTIFYRSFAAFTGEQLQAVALNFGLLFFVIYVGKHPGCSPSELTKALYLDWGYSQRSLNKLAKDGFLSKEKHGRSYTLTPVSYTHLDVYKRQLHDVYSYMRVHGQGILLIDDLPQPPKKGRKKK